MFSLFFCAPIFFLFKNCREVVQQNCHIVTYVGVVTYVVVIDTRHIPSQEPSRPWGYAGGDRLHYLTPRV